MPDFDVSNASLSDLKKLKEAMAERKAYLEMERFFNYWVEKYKDEKKAIKKFLMGGNGVSWDNIYWFIKYKKDECPSEASDLESIVELYKTDRTKVMSRAEGEYYIEKLKPLGFSIYISKYAGEDQLRLMTSTESGYGGHTYHMTRRVSKDDSIDDDAIVKRLCDDE